MGENEHPARKKTDVRSLTRALAAEFDEDAEKIEKASEEFDIQTPHEADVEVTEDADTE